MASGTRTRPSLECDIHDDQSHYYAQERQQSKSPVSVLGELPLGNFYNISKPAVDALAIDLGNFHFNNPTKENIPDQQKPTKTRGHKGRPHVEFNTFQAPLVESSDVARTSSGTGASIHSQTFVDFQTSSLSAAIRELPSNAEQLSKHQAATRVEGDESGSVDGAAAAEEMSTISTTHADTIIIRMASPQREGAVSRRTSEVALGAKKDDIVEQLIALPPANPTSRIEDSVEALDKLEEELEALNEVTHLERVLSPETSKGGAVAQNIDSSLKRTGSTRKSGASTVRVRTATDRSSSVRKSASMTFSQDKEKSTSANSKAPRKSLVTRPASLLPPKPPAKSSKPPTLSTFELPGEAVARRLKEQREARLSRQITPEQAALAAQAYSPSKPHVKSTKQPTRPTFELPGEAISRRKREEQEAKLRAQEEEERKRREFKARPIRASIVPGSYPRETIASRARQDKMAGQSEGGSSAGTATPGTVARKRQSMAAATPSQRSSLSATMRGRSELAVGAAVGTSRATSTSTGSIHGGGAGASSVVSVSKRSTVSAEDQQQQKARGRNIFARDNSIAAERERERREKESATKIARQEAAERSRQLSREWAEKQRMKRMSMAASTS